MSALLRRGYSWFPRAVFTKPYLSSNIRAASFCDKARPLPFDAKSLGVTHDLDVVDLGSNYWEPPRLLTRASGGIFTTGTICYEAISEAPTLSQALTECKNLLTTSKLKETNEKFPRQNIWIVQATSNYGEKDLSKLPELLHELPLFNETSQLIGFSTSNYVLPYGFIRESNSLGMETSSENQDAISRKVEATPLPDSVEQDKKEETVLSITVMSMPLGRANEGSKETETQSLASELQCRNAFTFHVNDDSLPDLPAHVNYGELVPTKNSSPALLLFGTEAYHNKHADAFMARTDTLFDTSKLFISPTLPEMSDEEILNQFMEGYPAHTDLFFAGRNVYRSGCVGLGIVLEEVKSEDCNLSPIRPSDLAKTHAELLTACVGNFSTVYHLANSTFERNMYRPVGLAFDKLDSIEDELDSAAGDWTRLAPIDSNQVRDLLDMTFAKKDSKEGPEPADLNDYEVVLEPEVEVDMAPANESALLNLLDNEELIPLESHSPGRASNHLEFPPPNLSARSTLLLTVCENLTVFPGQQVTLTFSDPRSKMMLRRAIEDKRPIGLLYMPSLSALTRPNGSKQVIGTAMSLERLIQVQEGSWTVSLRGLKRFQVSSSDIGIMANHFGLCTTEARFFEDATVVEPANVVVDNSTSLETPLTELAEKVREIGLRILHLYVSPEDQMAFARTFGPVPTLQKNKADPTEASPSFSSSQAAPAIQTTPSQKPASLSDFSHWISNVASSYDLVSQEELSRWLNTDNMFKRLQWQLQFLEELETKLARGEDVQDGPTWTRDVQLEEAS